MVIDIRRYLNTLLITTISGGNIMQQDSMVLVAPVMIIGEKDTGKSTLIQSFLHNKSTLTLILVWWLKKSTEHHEILFYPIEYKRTKFVLEIVETKTFYVERYSRRLP
ncbi:hypothetical protein RF11_06257 [Thelohanellus kitauei]|uniref:Uncharacterized protein n=1 Tax=Thelohanellus kitauei TaxID=669202 RepID=A0A0C2J2N6_THEKT|nr:hypothetical protein RF11_06257 [Thelohanellus kitauei]